MAEKEALSYAQKDHLDPKMRKRHDAQQQNDDEYDNIDQVDEDDDSDNDDAKSYTSNQTEDDSDEEGPGGSDDDETETDHQENDRENSIRSTIDPPNDCKQFDKSKIKGLLPPLIRPMICTKPLPAVLSVPVADSNKKGIQEPRPPRGSGTFSHSAAAVHATAKTDNNKKTRQKFQFPDAELLNLVLEDERAGNFSPSATSTRGGNAGGQRRRFSSTAAVMATTLPLRRKSFSLTKGPTKPATVLPSLPPPAMSPSKSTRFQARRKSTSACYSLRNGAKSPLFNKNLVSSLPPLARSASASPMAAAAAAAIVLPPMTSSSTSQMVLRVRERKSDGIPELVISKRPARFLVWNWTDRQIRIPFNIQLGPHQHGVMLRQLRYVKSVMNDFPWAKTHLKDLLAAYTKKDMSKEELFPQLNQLSNQVQQEIGTQVKKQKQLMIKKQRLTMQLSLATSVINEMNVTKYGRRGKPHDTKLHYDPGQPTKLQWIRKNGDRSSESLEVDLVEIHFYDADSKESELSAGIKKAVKKFAQTATLDSFVSLVTPQRTLDLQLKNAIHREWLMNALCDVISFARQYRAAGARRDNHSANQHAHVLRRM